MSFFRYTRYLEQQIADLKEEKASLQARNDKLVDALVPILRKMNTTTSNPASPVAEAQKLTHQIEKNESSARCACGWHFMSDDPARLQNEISAHHRENVAPLKGGRRSWPQLRAQAEQEGERTQ